MVDYEDNFDDFLKRKIEETEFEYNDAYWQKANSLIQSQNGKKKKNRFGFWLLSAIALLGLLSGAYYLGMRHSQQMINENVAQQVAIHEPVNKPQHEVADVVIESSNENSSLNENAKSEVKENASDETNPLIKPKQTKPIIRAKNKINATVTGQILNQEYKNKKGIAEQNNSNSKASQTSGKKSITRAMSKQEKAASVVLVSNKRFAAVDAKIAHLSMSARNLNFPLHIDPEIITTFEGEDDGTAAPLGKIRFILEDSSLTGFGDDGGPINPQLYCENKKPLQWLYTAFAGLSDSRGFEHNKSTSLLSGFGYFGGAGVYYIVDKHWLVGAQPTLYLRGAVNTQVISYKADFDFGKNESDFIVNTKQLLFVELPVMVNYRVNRHTIGLGVGAEYLINTKSDVKDFGETDYKPNQWGYTGGYNRFGLMSALTYNFRLFDQVALMVMIQKGFTDFTKDGYFTENGKDRNFNMRMGINYTFQQKHKYVKP